MMAAAFWDRWGSPAGGSGGTSGDIVAALIWAVLVSIASYVSVPRVRTWINNHVQGLHEKLESQHSETMAQAEAHHKETVAQA